MGIRRSLIAIAAAGVALAVLFVVLLIDGEPDSPSERAAGLARSTCGTMRDVLEDVRRNVAADRVLRSLDRAGSSAEEAADLDPRWRSLAGGVSGLEVAFRKDDPGAASVGMSVVTTECQRTGVSVR